MIAELGTTIIMFALVLFIFWVGYTIFRIKVGAIGDRKDRHHDPICTTCAKVLSSCRCDQIAKRRKEYMEGKK